MVFFFFGVFFGDLKVFFFFFFFEILVFLVFFWVDCELLAIFGVCWGFLVDLKVFVGVFFFLGGGFDGVCNTFEAVGWRNHTIFVCVWGGVGQDKTPRVRKGVKKM